MSPIRPSRRPSRRLPKTPPQPSNLKSPSLKPQISISILNNLKSHIPRGGRHEPKALKSAAPRRGSPRRARYVALVGSYSCEVFICNMNPPPPPAGPAHDAHPRVLSASVSFFRVQTFAFFLSSMSVSFVGPLATSCRFWGPFGLPREGPGKSRGAKRANFGDKSVRAQRFVPDFCDKYANPGKT